MVQHLDIRKAISLGIVFAFLVNTSGPLPAYAQDFVLPAPGVMVHLSPVFDPPILKGIKVHPDDPFRFEFILDRGDSQLTNDALKDESSKLIKYFLASLTIPEKDLWVNLSPYEKDRIIPNSFGLTEMGRDLLAEDYMLKQITASLIYPEGEMGKRFWKRIYEEAARKFGTTNIPVNTFNKVWIVPEKAVVYENAKIGAAYVVESKLKVMLEQDYLSLQKHEGIQSGPAQAKDTNQLGSQIVREIVIPELTKEVNEDKNFSQLRQVYNSLILATWYKKKIKDSILEQVYADKNKVVGVNIDDPKEKERIYQRYLQAFRKGVYNYIKEDPTPEGQVVPRKYFSGGEELIDVPLQETTDGTGIDLAQRSSQYIEEVRIDQAMGVNPRLITGVLDWLRKTLQDKITMDAKGNGRVLVLIQSLEKNYLTDNVDVMETRVQGIEEALSIIHLTGFIPGNDPSFELANYVLVVLKQIARASEYLRTAPDLIIPVEKIQETRDNKTHRIIYSYGNFSTSFPIIRDEMIPESMESISRLSYQDQILFQRMAEADMITQVLISLATLGPKIIEVNGRDAYRRYYSFYWSVAQKLGLTSSDAAMKAGDQAMTGAGSPEVKDLNNEIPATAIDALNDHSIRGSGISFRRLGLLKGAILILPGNLSTADVLAIKHSGKDFNIIFESGVPKLMPPQHFGFNSTGLSALDEHLKILQSIQEYARIRQDVKEPIVVVDWGCGDGMGLIALQKHLIEKNIGNVELIGYANRFENAWNEAPQGITFTTDIRYLKGKKVSIIYSNLGLHHFLEDKIPKETILAHLNELKSVMDEQGVLKMFPPNSLPVAMLKEVFPTVRVIDEQDSVYEGAYYAEASLKIGSGDRAMAVNDFSRDDWYVKGHPVDLNDNLYHNLQHSINVARMAYDFAKARGLTEAQAQLFYQIGLLHDYDPGRPASTRPRVPSTLNLVEKDFQGVRSLDGRAGYSFLQNRLGWTKKEFLTAKAVIQRTEYPFDNSHSNPAYQGNSPVKEYKNILEEIKSLDPSGELLGFVLTQAPLFSEYIDKLNWYAASEDFDQLLRVTRGLTDEMNTELKLSGQAGGVKPKAYDFMVSLGDPRSFSIDRELAREEGITLDLPDLGTVLRQLPRHYAENFSRNLRGITAMRRALEGGMPEDDPGLIEIGRAAALRQEGGGNDEAMKAGSDNEVFEGFRARLLDSVFSFPLQDGRVLPLVLAEGHNYFPHVPYFINLSVMPSSDGLKEFPELKAIYEHGSNDPSKTGILGTIGVQIVFDEHDRPVLIIKYNQTNPGFSGRIPMKQRRQFLRWAESAHLKIIEAAKAMGIQRIYAKSAEYAIGTVLNYPINVQNILRVPGGREILEQLFNKNIIEQDDDGYVSIKPNINLDSNEIRTITKDEDAFKIIWDILKQSHKMSRNNVNFNYEMPYKNKPIWEKVPVSQETEELFPYEARNSLPLWQYIGGTGGNAQIVDKDRAMAGSSMTNYLGTKYKEIRLNGGATQIIPANLSASDIAEIMRGDKEFVLKLDSEGPPYLWPYTKGWDVNGTHFSELDDSFEIMNKIEELQKERKENKSSKPIVIVDWGCGYGTGLIELQQELFRKGIRNVKLIGYSYESFPQWHNAPSGIVFTNIISYIKEADFIYSYSGLVNMFYANIMTPQESEKHLRILRNILGEKGVLRTDLLKDEEWNGKLMSKVFLIKVVDKRTRHNNTPYYIEGSYKAIPDAAMKAGDRAMNAEEIQKPSKTGGIDLSPANLNLQTHNAGQTIKFHLDPATLKQLQNAPGFVPVIINIQPLKSLSEFLGLNQTKIT